MSVEYTEHPTHGLLQASPAKKFDRKEANEYVAALRGIEFRRIILDLSEVGVVTTAALRILTPVVNQHMVNDRQILTVCDAETEALVKEIGLDWIFDCYRDVATAVAGRVETHHGGTAELLGTIIQSAQSVISDTTGMKFEAGKPYARSKGPKPECEIGSLVGIVSPAFRGTLVMGMTADLLLKLMSKMMGEEMKELDTETQQGAAEFLNMILGHSKHALSRKNIRIDQTIPSLFVGTDFQILPTASNPSMIIPFKSSEGSFYFELSTIPKQMPVSKV